MFSSMVEAFKKMETGILEETEGKRQARRKAMYEIGKKRPDGKFNVWKKAQVGQYREWVIESVCDSIEEAIEYALSKNRDCSKKKYDEKNL